MVIGPSININGQGEVGTWQYIPFSLRTAMKLRFLAQKAEKQFH